MNFDAKLLEALAQVAIPLSDSMSDYDALFDYIGDAQIVLLGEATHGTHEFYRIRAELSKQLIAQKGFNAIAIEGDWPDAHAINLYIHGQTYTSARDALSSFDRFPTWMWRNVPMLDFTEWLQLYNQKQASQETVGFYGLDLYSLYRSIDVVLNELKKIDPVVAREAESYYACFEQYRHDAQAYGYAVFAGQIASCESEVLEQLKKTQEEVWSFLAHNKITADQALDIEQNAHVIKNAEQYYRQLFFSQVSNWNLRDSHMFQTLEALIRHYERKGIKKPKIIVWAHNSHVGNASATQMGWHGEYNIGQLAKERFGSQAVSVGFTTHHGTVSAASAWHQPVERKKVRDALPQSYEAFFHELDIPQFMVLLGKHGSVVPPQMLERAIGVVYQPQTERLSHYFDAQLAKQFDAIIHCDTTTALEPLDTTTQWISGEVPETYPFGT